MQHGACARLLGVHLVNGAGHSLADRSRVSGEISHDRAPIPAYAECHDWHWVLKEDERQALAAKP